MKYLLITIFFIFAVMISHAQGSLSIIIETDTGQVNQLISEIDSLTFEKDKDPYMMIVQKDDAVELYSISLSDIHKVTFDDDSMSVFQADDGILKMNFFGFHKILFVNENLSALETLSNQQKRAFVYQAPDGNSITIVTGSEKPQSVVIWDIDGVVCYSEKDPFYKSTIDISGLPPGVYMLKTGNECIKFRKH